MILKISRLNKIISIRVCLLVKPAAQMFVKIDLIRENSRNHPVLSPLLQWIDKWLPKTDHRQPITISLSLFRIVHNANNVPFCDVANFSKQFEKTFNSARLLRIFIPRSRNCEVLQNSSNPWNSSDKFHLFRMERKGRESKRDHFLPLNSNRFLSIFIIAILYPPIYSP